MFELQEQFLSIGTIYWFLLYNQWTYRNTNDIDNHLILMEVVCPLYHVTVTVGLFLQRSCRRRYRRKWRLTTVPCWSYCDISGPVSQCPPNPWKKRFAFTCKPFIMGVKVRSGNKATQFHCAFILEQLLNLHIAKSGGMGNLFCYYSFHNLLHKTNSNYCEFAVLFTTCFPTVKQKCISPPKKKN